MNFFLREFRLVLFLALISWLFSARANVPGGGTGTGSNVTLTDNGTTVTLANGIISIVITKTSAEIATFSYTYNNSGTVVTNQLLSGGNGGSGGYLYWFQNGGSFIAGPFTETVVANNGSYAEISLAYASPTNGIMDIHYSMLRGSPGFYTTAILTHRSQDGITHIELRPNIYGGSEFNWMSVDAARNRIMEVSGGLSIPVQGAPKECYLWTNGIYAGQYEDKYKYSADLANLPAWGWSSVGTGGKNVGLWNITASPEYNPGGPMERSLMEHIGTTILNVFTGGYYGLATDNDFLDGEIWSKVYGPYFYYCNNVTNVVTSANQAALALYTDALAQGAAEKTAWPYSWFTNTSYTPAANRGAVTGKISISDSGNPNASAANLWVGVAQQPSVDVSYDFQQWTKPYQFWAKTDAIGNFSISNVVAGANYTLSAFGPGAAGTFMSQTLTGGNPPLLYNLPTSPFSVTVSGGATTNLGTVTWIPTRVGATVFEIGYPDRTAAKFRHGDDYWVGDIGPSSSAPSPIWSKWLEYPFDFPNGVNYTVGQNRWSTDWNFIQPVTTDSQGNYNSSSSTITFNLATAPTNGATASIYLGLCSDYYSAVVISVNGVNAASLSGLAASPNSSVPSTGYYVAYGDSDSNIREGNNGAFTDERLTFSAAALHQGQNTITISFREISANYFADHLMYDYLRLELTGYVPPPPASVVAFPGNNGNLICWPVMPGATSYNILRSTTSGSGYVSITNGVIGPVCGSGSNNAVYFDSTAANNTTNYYVVRSGNPTGSSTNSPQSSGATPLATISTSAPSPPTELAVSSATHQSVTLNWNASSGANFYSVWRSTLENTGGGSSNALSTIILNNAITGTSYTDTSPTDGSIYSYFVTATSAGGTSGNSTSAVGVALPTAPAAKPASLTAAFYQSTNIVLNWTAVPGAVGYVIKRATNAAGPFTLLQSVTETVYYDIGLNASSTYYYQIIAVNAAGVSITATNSANGLQPAPTSLSAVGDNAEVTLSWAAASGATSYTIKRGTSSGNETNTVVSGFAGITYTNTGLVNETTYYYVVIATGSGGNSGSSAEASATASAASSGAWAVDADGNWNTATDWSGGLIAFGPGNTADFSTITLTTNHIVTLDSARTISGLTFGDLAATFNWTLTGSNTLTLGANPNINVVNQSATINTSIAGSAGLMKTGAGTLILGGVTETFSNGLAVNDGILTLDFTATNSPVTNIVSAINSLTLGGGTLQITGSTNVVPSSQTFASTALNTGGSAISAAPVSGTNNPTLTLAAMTENLGGTVEFVGPATTNSSGNVAATANITTTTGGTGTFGAIGSFGSSSSKGAYATVGLYDFASTDTSAGGAGSSPFTIIGGSQVSGFYQTTGITTTSAGYDVPSSGGGNSLGNANGSPMVRFNIPTAITLTFTVTTANGIQGILVTPKCGANNETLFGSGANGLQFVRSTTVANDYGVIWQNNLAAYLNVNCVLQPGRLLNGGGGNSCGLVQDGIGTVVYAGVNDYDLATYLNGGYSVVSADSGFGRPSLGGTINLNGGTVVGNATFTMDNAGANARPFILGSAGGGLAATAGNTMTIDGLVSGSGQLSIGIPASSANNNKTALLSGSGPGTANTTSVYATGTVLLTNVNTLVGLITVNSGTLALAAGNLANSTVYQSSGITINNGATVQINADNSIVGSISNNVPVTINTGGTLTGLSTWNSGAGPSTHLWGILTLNGGTLTNGGTGNIAYGSWNLDVGVVAGGVTNTSTISAPDVIPTQAGGTVFNVVSGATSGVDLNVAGTLVAGSLLPDTGIIKAGNGTMALSAANTFTNGTTINVGILRVNATETAGISGPLGKSGSIAFGGGTLQFSAVNHYDYSGRFSSAANQFISVDTASQNVTFASALTSSGGTLTKLGAGTLTLTGANTYSGATLIGNGTLAINNASGSATGTGIVTVQNGGTLTGAGTLAGFVTVAAGGKFGPGNPLGVLTISNNLSLASGSTAYFQVQHLPLTNNSVNVSGTMTQDGTLIVTNSGAAAFIAGDSFKLFSATGYAGAFSSFNLPVLNGGLFWSTSRLTADGTLGVVWTNPPAIRSVAMSGGNLVLQGTNGTPNWNYTVLSSTNLTLPLAQWTATATNFFDASGNFNWTNSTGANGSQQFFVIKVQ